MSTGDLENMLHRLISYLPPWFGEDFPTLRGILYGAAYLNAFIYSLIDYAKAQTRLQTATDNNLELIAQDYIGFFPRRLNESDETYRRRIKSNIIRMRNTREAYISVLKDLTGRTPIILEGFRPEDTNYLNGGLFLNVNSLGNLEPYTIYILAFRPLNNSVAFSGLDVQTYSLNAGIFLADSKNDLLITDQDILDAVDSVRSAGITAITYIFD